MKKVSVFYDKKLQQLIGCDRGFTDLPLIGHVWTLIGFVVEMATTGVIPKFTRPLSTDGRPSLFDPTPEDVNLLTSAYKQSGRIEIFVRPGNVDVCLGVNIEFLPMGRPGTSILSIEGVIEPSALRSLKISSSPSLVTALMNFDEIFAQPVTSLDFSTFPKRKNRTIWVLHNHHIMTIGQVVRNVDPDWLLHKVRNFGKKCMQALDTALGKHDLFVGKYLGERPGPLETEAIKKLPIHDFNLGSDGWCVVMDSLEHTSLRLIGDLFSRERVEEALRKNSGLPPGSMTKCLEVIPRGLAKEGLKEGVTWD